MVTQIYTFAESSQSVHLKCVLMFVTYASIKLILNELSMYKLFLKTYMLPFQEDRYMKGELKFAAY
jgi:hypothetical protein